MRATTRIPDLIQWAEENIPIRTVLKLTGTQLRGRDRADCAICFEERALSIHDHENFAYCFGCGTGYSTVRYYGTWEYGPDIERDFRFRIARKLIGITGIRPGVVAREEPKIDGYALRGALQTWCSVYDPGWRTHQYDEDVLGYLLKWFELTDRIKTMEDCARWLDAAKTGMKGFFDRTFGLGQDAPRG